MWWPSIQHDQVGVTIAVEIRDQHLAATPPVASQALARRQRTEAAIQVVVQQLDRAIAVDKKIIEIAVVIRIENRTAGTVARMVQRCRRVRMPASGGGLTPELIFPLAAKINIEQAIVIDIPPQGAPHAFDPAQRVLIRRLKRAAGAKQYQ